MRHFVGAIRASIREGNYYSALLVALTLPDIAGWVDHGTSYSQERYEWWFNRYVCCPKYISTMGAARTIHCFLSGNDCFALRCSVLHQGMGDTSSQRASDALDRFVFTVPPPSGCIHCNQSDSKLQLQVDIFCEDICAGVEEWLRIIAGDEAKQSRLNQIVMIQDPRRACAFRPRM